MPPYVDHWVKVLQDDPKEILRASRNAEKIQEVVMQLEHTIENKNPINDNSSQKSPISLKQSQEPQYEFG